MPSATALPVALWYLVPCMSRITSRIWRRYRTSLFSVSSSNDGMSIPMFA